MYYFAINLAITDSARLMRVLVRFVNAVFLRIHRRMAEIFELASSFREAVEVDGSELGPQRICGKQGHSTYGKTICLWPFEAVRDGVFLDGRAAYRGNGTCRSHP